MQEPNLGATALVMPSFYSFVGESDFAAPDLSVAKFDLPIISLV
jgi:hypothetical protein